MNWMSTSFSSRSRRRAQKLVRIGVSQVLVELLARAPILIEHEQVRIVVADVEMVVHARGLGARRLDEAVQYLEELVPLFRFGVKIRDQGASRLHVVLPDKTIAAGRHSRTAPCSTAAVTIARRGYSGNSARSASVPDPPGGRKLAANAKARIGTVVPSGAMR